MPTYKYRAITEKGAIVEGVAPAASSRALSESLSRKGLFPSHVRRTLTGISSPRVGDDDLLFLIGELTVLIRSGIPIPEALAVVADQPNRSRLGAVVSEVRSEVTKGAALSEALADSTAHFDALLIALVKIGERSGELATTLQQYHQLLERRAMLKRKVFQALIYPIFILMLTGLIVSVLLFFSLPRFTELYADLGADLPGPTQALLAIVNGITAYGWIAALVFAISIPVLRYWVPTRQRKLILERILLRLPYIGKLVGDYSLSLCCHAMHSLLASGMTMDDALRQVGHVAPIDRHAEALRKAAERIHQGTGPISALRAQELFTPSALKLLEAGEKSGTVPAQFAELANYYDRLSEQRMGHLIAIFEPMLILVTGVMVGAAVVAMYLPIFGMAGAL